LAPLFKRKHEKPRVEPEREALGVFLFDSVPEAVAAERALRTSGYACQLIAPPFHLRGGCDLAVTVPSVERLGAERALTEADVHIRDWADSLEGTCHLVDLVTTVDFGEWLMVRAGNMKITVEKTTGRIVNTSGGGCPDIPYLNLSLVNHTLAEAPRPKTLGYTLCGVMLDRAFDEADRLLAEEGAS
jgi:hypothetical protein